MIFVGVLVSYEYETKAPTKTPVFRDTGAEAIRLFDEIEDTIVPSMIIFRTEKYSRDKIIF